MGRKSCCYVSFWNIVYFDSSKLGGKTLRWVSASCWDTFSGLRNMLVGDVFSHVSNHNDASQNKREKRKENATLEYLVVGPTLSWKDLDIFRTNRPHTRNNRKDATQHSSSSLCCVFRFFPQPIYV